MRKPAFCICENKDADQLRGNREADQRLVFATYILQSLYFLNLKFQASSCTARFVSDLVGNPEDRFSHNKARIKVGCKGVFITRTCYNDGVDRNGESSGWSFPVLDEHQ